MTEELKNLFSPLTIGNVTVRNRIMTTGTATGFAEDGIPSERHAYYYAERAMGGIGLIVMAFPVVHPTSQHVNGEIAGYDDRVVPGYSLISRMVHEHGTKIFAQLGHAGRQGKSIHSELPLWSASAIPCPANHEMPKAMEIEEIREIVDAHGSAARRVRDGGLDGVEIHSGYGGYLLSQFISPYSNERTDQYGGSLENRLRLVYEVIDAVRNAVGRDFVVGFQMNADDLSPNGLGLDEYQEIAQRLEATGKIDYLVVKASTYFCRNMNIPDMQHPLGLWVPYAAGIREVVKSIPVVAVARINDPILAERILEDGQADLIGMARQSICDPETPNKAREGRFDDIRQCIACNEGCQDNLEKGKRITCIHNPAVGREKSLGMKSIRRADRPKRVVVVGAGPAGLKAAEIAARCGHTVALLEKRPQLGGQVRIASLASGREEMIGVIRWLEGQVGQLGVDVRLSMDATTESVLAEEPDAVVVATGSVPVRGALLGYRSWGIDHVPGLDQPNVVTVWDVLEDDREIGHRVVVVDDHEGTWKAVSVAETLADRGRDVEIVSALACVGEAIGGMSKAAAFPRLFEKGIKLTPFTMVTSVSGSTVSVVEQGKERSIEGVDSVVLAGFNRPDEDLYYSLKGKVQELYRIGDCVAPRRVLEAIREGDQVGRQLHA